MRLGDSWGSIRGVVREHFSFAEIKDLTGAAGLPIHELAHIQQKYSGGASKGQLMDHVDGLVGRLEPEQRDRFMSACVSEVLRRNEQCRGPLEEALARVGWGLSGTEPFPLRLQLDLETTQLPPPVQKSLADCLRRYRNGDAAGAMTSVCGVVDGLTAAIYENGNLGDHRGAAYQERVSKSFATLEENYVRSLCASGLTTEIATRIWQNHRGAVNQAAYVLVLFRQQFADVHGAQDTPLFMVQRALDCAAFVVRSLTMLGLPHEAPWSE